MVSYKELAVPDEPAYGYKQIIWILLTANRRYNRSLDLIIY